MIKSAVISGGLVMAAAVGLTAEPDDSVGLANPASTYCVEKGGKLEIRNEARGAVGYCHLPDGRVIEEWAFFRKENARRGTR